MLKKFKIDDLDSVIMNLKEMTCMEDEKKIVPLKSLPGIAELIKSETLEEVQKVSFKFKNSKIG